MGSAYLCCCRWGKHLAPCAAPRDSAGWEWEGKRMSLNMKPREQPGHLWTLETTLPSAGPHQGCRGLGAARAVTGDRQMVSCLQAGSRYPRAAWTLASSEVARRKSLAAQWFGPGAFTALDPSSIPSQETKILHGWHSQKEEEEIAGNQETSRASLAACTPAPQPCLAGCFHPGSAGLSWRACSDADPQALG